VSSRKRSAHYRTREKKAKEDQLSFRIEYYPLTAAVAKALHGRQGRSGLRLVMVLVLLFLLGRFAWSRFVLMRVAGVFLVVRMSMCMLMLVAMDEIAVAMFVSVRVRVHVLMLVLVGAGFFVFHGFSYCWCAANNRVS
jgi:hypothetical protein